MSFDISVECRSICRLRCVGRHIGWYVDREWLSDCRPTCRLIGYRHSSNTSLIDILEKEIFVPKYFWGATCLPSPSASYGPICICTAVIHLSTLLNKDWICGTWSEHKAIRNFWGWCITYTSVIDSLSFIPIYHRRSTDTQPTINGRRIGPVLAAISTEISAESQSICRLISWLIHRSICQSTYCDIGRVSTDMSVDISVNTQPICWLIHRSSVGRIYRSRGAQNTHDPKKPCNHFQSLEILVTSTTHVKNL